MNKKLVNFIVKKYLRFDKKNPFIFVTIILAFIGVAVGVMVLIISMSIMNGTSKEFKNKLFIMNYPLSIYPKYQNSVDEKLLEKLEKNYPKLKFSPYISAQAIVQKNDEMSGALIFGVDQLKEANINPIYEKATKHLKLKKYDLIVGKDTKEELMLFKGDKVTLYFTSLDPSGFSMMPKMKRFEYKSYFTSGLHAYDKAYIYTSIEALQTILKKPKNSFDGIHVYSKDAFKDIDILKKDLKDQGVGIIGWWQQNGNFFSAMKMEKRALFIVLMLIILVASLNIISSLLMTVMSRRKEIALLLSMGATYKEIKLIFLKLGIIIGFSGILMGIFLGFLGMWVLGTFDIISLPADVYGTSKLPLDLSLIDFISIIIGAVVIIILSSYYPAKKATKINIIDVLRNE